ncbi:response regulator transcription factor [Spirosoma utsteinense]|uniref:DNA-binding response OmpR family regulator n=1 Tax=Spirosoma utsteinense TaxID=2585773 RepID=A0ABR6WD70_9BACT|nr:response regulator [Spirosoma utsteinense]MBC3794505.1 DNA-binding response OmpR family regulator [Spirosoma utsteinense]
MARILVVEDDVQLRENIQEQLELDTHEVRAAANGRQALELLPSFVPDLIVCDVVMPEMDGIEFIRVLKNSLDYRSIPFIFLTAKATQQDMINGLEEGAFDYLFKPFLRRELILKVNNITRQQADRSRYQPREVKEESGFQFITQFNTQLSQQFGNASLTAEKMAEALNMSRSAFQRSLVTFFGKNFSEIVKEYRLQKATTYLVQSDQSIQWIADRCGFSSLSYFSVCFKKATQTSPLSFRLKARQNLNS